MKQSAQQGADFGFRRDIKMVDSFGMIQMVISTLNEIEVKGKDNMSKLLGCINALTEIINQPKDEDGEKVNNGG